MGKKFWMNSGNCFIANSLQHVEILHTIPKMINPNTTISIKIKTGNKSSINNS
jgi:hypothetical protein